LNNHKAKPARTRKINIAYSPCCFALAPMASRGKQQELFEKRIGSGLKALPMTTYLQ